MAGGLIGHWDNEITAGLKLSPAASRTNLAQTQEANQPEKAQVDLKDYLQSLWQWQMNDFQLDQVCLIILGGKAFGHSG